MSLPRVMKLDADGTLRVTILPQAKALRAGTVPHQETRAGVLKTLRKASGEVVCTGTRGGAFSLKMDDGVNELVRVDFSAERHSFSVDGHEIALQAGDVPAIHAYVDGSVIEMILGERTGYTKRFYYTGATAPDVQVLAAGASVKLEAWKVAPISANRLTTPARM